MLKLGLVWRKDNGPVISHVNIFKMPIASRQPFTSDICEEHQHLGKAGRQESPFPQQQIQQLVLKQGAPFFPSADGAVLIYC